MRLDPVRLLAAYAGVLTLGLVAVAAMAAAPRRIALDEIDAQRINIREPDGRLRLVIANRARFPGAIVRGKETPFDRASAGMIFFNDEATENGGLIVSGARDASGKVSSVGHLSFDQYEQDQVVNLQQDEDGGVRRAGLTISDRPETPLDLLAGLRLRADPAALKRALSSGAFGQPRAFFGKTENRSSELVLRDAAGKARLRLSVSAAGAARIAFLDADGKVTRAVEP